MATSKSVRAPMREIGRHADPRKAAPLRDINQQLIWQDAMPRWDAWVKHLGQRKKPIPLRKLLPQGEKSPLCWSVPAAVADETVDLITRLDRLRVKQKQAKQSKSWVQSAATWLSECKTRPTSLAYALEVVAWAHGLPALAARLPEELWTELCETLVRISSEACNGHFPKDALQGQLIAGELPLTLTYLLPELPRCVALTQVAREVIAEGIEEMLDGEGQPHARYLASMRMLLACWTRCIYIDRMLKKQRIGKPARQQYEWLIRQAFRWTRRDGSEFFGNGHFSRASFVHMMDSAVDLAGDETDVDIMRSFVAKSHQSDGDASSLPVAAEHSEWAETAVLRTDWHAKSDAFALTYHDRQLRSEFVVGGKVIWSGDTQPRVSFDGTALKPQSDWEEVCWESDYDVNYIELEMEFERGCRLQRQVLMARGDRFLLVADALKTSQSGKLEISNSLPLAEDVSLTESEETHEAFLNTSKRIAAVLPLSLPEWRTDRHLGAIHGQRAAFTQSGTGSGLYAAMFIDFEPARQRSPLTWRQLTVTESLAILTPDQAVAYRVQVGKRQWIIYRSLGPPGNRTFLGQNLVTEFVVARFDRSGELTNLIELE